MGGMCRKAPRNQLFGLQFPSRDVVNLPYVTAGDTVTSMAPKVFISCSDTDAVLAAKLADGADARGLGGFTLRRDIGPGSNTVLETVRAVTGCRVAVFLLSPGAVASERVMRELVLAVEERRRIVPLAMPDTAYPVGLPAEWTYWLSAVHVTAYQGLDETLDLLERLLAASTTGPVGGQTARRGRRLLGSTGQVAVDLTAPGRAGRGSEVAPSALLRAQSRAMPLIGREEELTRLESWAMQDDLFSTRVITGAAGQGKSRLAAELSAHLTAAGWQAIEVRGASTAEVVGRLGDKPSLLMVDYAETRVNEVSRLVEAVAEAELFAAVRLLLLARSSGEWWIRLTSGSAVVDELLATTRMMPLSSLANDPDKARAIYQAARTGFQTALGLPVDDLVDATYRRQRSVYDIIESALADVMSTGAWAGETQSTTSPLLAHERRYVRGAARNDGLGHIDSVDLDRFLTVLTVFGAESERSAIELLRTIDGSLEESDLRKLARLCRRLYPGDDLYIGGIKPDSLAEKLVAQVVSDDPDVLSGNAILRSAALGATKLRRALTIMARTAVSHPSVVPHLRRIVTEASFETLAAAVEVSTQVPDPTVLVNELTYVIQAQMRTPAEAASMLALVPDETVALAEFAGDLAKSAIEGLPPEGTRNLGEIRLLLDASSRFSDAGWGALAATTADSATRDLERLATDQEALAVARCNLSNRLWEIGKVGAALTPARLAVVWFTEAGVDSFAAAAAETNLAFRLVEVGVFDAAADHAHNAVHAFRALRAVGVKGAEAGLATALNNLACISVARGEYQAATDYGGEAVRIRRAQAFDNRDRFLPFIARILANSAPAMLATGDSLGARKLIAEARALHQITARKAPIFAYEEVESATIDAVMLATQGQTIEARSLLELAARLLRPLSELGELHDRLALAIDHNLGSLPRDGAVGWDAVNVLRHGAAPNGGGTRLILPQLLEYKDL
jgi:hypothetical protein